MILKTCQATNFASYRELSFDFQDQGLALVQGSTGSGKSTLFDIACWALYGVTAKDGSVDDVRSWLSDEPTQVALVVELAGGQEITVIRQRGKSSSQNDLVWWETGAEYPERGKDLTDTQKRLNERLGVDSELFLLAAYYSEFSPSAHFFTAKAPERRALLERVAALDLPVKLAEKASEGRKSAKKELQTAKSVLDKAQARASQLQDSLTSADRYLEGWEEKHQEQLAQLAAQSQNFAQIKESKIAEAETKVLTWEAKREEKLLKYRSTMEKLSANTVPPESYDVDEAILTKRLASARSTDVCAECGNPDLKAIDHIMARLEKVKEARRNNNGNLAEGMSLQFTVSELEASENPHLDALEDAQAMANVYAKQLEAAKGQHNPFVDQVAGFAADLTSAVQAEETAERQVSELEKRVTGLDKLYELSFVLRGEILAQTVASIEADVNGFLEGYFESEIRVEFTVAADGQGLDIGIQKSGHRCVYRQLSKGQRQILRLTFWLAVMQAASNASGKHFDSVFLDEALDGLDDSLKLKAFGLFEAMSKEHSTVLVIDHNEALKASCGKRYTVTMEADESSITEEGA